MSIVCKDCGFENEDSDKHCVMCDAELFQLESNEGVGNRVDSLNLFEEKNDVMVRHKENVVFSEKIYGEKSSGAQRYFVNCEISRKKTMVESAEISSYFCDGCKEEHFIDGFLWIVQEEMLQELTPTIVETVTVQAKNAKREKLVLETVDTHFEIEINCDGGTLGRYGTYGADYFQSDPRGRMVSGEHCRFKYEYGRWSIEHLSRTNDTVYNGRKLEHGYEEALRDGKIITLANAISFIVRII